MKNSSSDKVLNPTVVKLGLVSLFADISSEMLYPITPIFLTTVLGASMTSVGFIEGVAEATASLMKTYSGAWSDRISRRKPFVAFGYLLAALAKPLIGISTSWTHVLVARGLDRTGKGIRTAPRDALLAEAVSEKLRGAAFGWHRAMDSLGAAIGPLLAILYLSANHHDLRKIYFWAVIPGLLSVLFALTVSEPRQSRAKVQSKFRLRPLSTLSKPFRKFLVSWGIFSLTNSSDVFLLMKTKAAGVGLTEVILLYCFYNLTYSLLSPYFGGLSDRIGRKKLLLGGLGVFSAVYLGFSIAAAQWEFWALFGIYGLYMAATDGVGKALAVDLINPEEKATGLGILGTVTGVATVIASSVAGLLWDHAGSTATFVYGASGALLSMLILMRVPESSRLRL